MTHFSQVEEDQGTNSPLGQQLITSQVARLVHFLIEVTVLRLDGIGGQEHSSFRWAVDVIIENALLHLQEEQALGDVLDQFLRHILWVELGPELEEQRTFLPHILCSHLGGTRRLWRLSNNRLW